MKYIFLIVTFFLTSLYCNAQYILQPAFPNLQNFSNPVEIVNSKDGTNRLFIVQQHGKIEVIENSPTVNTKKTFIDLTNQVSHYILHGLIGLTFHPDYENNNYFYVHYTFDSLGSPSGKWIRIARFTTSSTNPDSALISTQLTILKIPLVGGAYHYGGRVEFGPDGNLYISTGDGPLSVFLPSPALDSTSLLGKLLRINVDSAAGGNNYSIPSTNPFYGNMNGFKEEIFALGFRNLYKFSFDNNTGIIWGGDVGQGTYEEIDLIENGKNYGWDKMEGFNCFPYTSCDTAGYGFARPIFTYVHSGGQHSAIVGGYVYRGKQHPDLYGKYMYADYNRGIVWALNYDGINPTTTDLLQDTTIYLSSLGEDENNEIYLCSYDSLAGTIYKIVKKDVSTLSLRLAIEGFYNKNYDILNISDTVKINIREQVSPFALVDESTAIIDSLNFDGYAIFNNTPNGNYYLQIQHRNGLETWSNSAGIMMAKGEISSFDFTTANSQAYGNNLKLIDSKYCIFSGDVNKDQNIDLNDLNLIYNDALEFFTGYKDTDLNGNNMTEIADLLLTYNNTLNYVSVINP